MSIVSAVLLVLFICASAHGKEECSNTTCNGIKCCEGLFCSIFNYCFTCRAKGVFCFSNDHCCSKHCKKPSLVCS
ncbi:unnamed protein product [Hymenolepis diminuta]|uniref:Uncharacterized protein n=1 Tax=Hymenolepis diminuta TaxID=6216 RepID=A0A564YRD1_HYMDI|nr:unnamed protein product [Hymenolepis diminuta]